MSEQQTPLEAAEAFLEANRSQPDKMTVATAWNGSQHLTYSTVRALVAQIRLDEQRLADRDRLAAENADLRADVAKLRTAAESAWKILGPIWNQVAPQVVALWKMIEPILETDTERDQMVYEPSNRDRGSCTVCGAVITYIEGISPASSGWEHVDELIDIAHKAQFGSAR